VLYGKVLESLALKRAKAESLAEDRRSEAYESIPELGQIDNELGKIGISLARYSLSNDAGKLNKAKQDATRLKKRKSDLLNRSGIGEDRFRPVYSCAECSDTGFVEARGGGFSRCRCLKQMLIDEYYSASNMRESLTRENFEMFDVRLFSSEIDKIEGLSPRTNMENIFRHASCFVENFGNEFRNLLFYGEPGLGKTFMCNAIAKDLLDTGRTVLYLSAPRLCKIVDEYRFNRDSHAESKELIETVDEVDLFILDDLGTEFPSVTSSAALFDMINERILRRKPTVISTNLDPDDMSGQYSERLVSRFFGMFDVLRFFGDDVRVKIKYNRLNLK